MKIYFSDSLNTVLDTDIIKGFHLYMNYSDCDKNGEGHPMAAFVLVIYVGHKPLNLYYNNNFDLPRNEYKIMAQNTWAKLEEDHRYLQAFFLNQDNPDEKDK